MIIKKRFVSIYQIVAAICIKLFQDPRCLVSFPREIIDYYQSYRMFRKNHFGKEDIDLRPIFFQRNVDSKYDAHYVIQSWWASLRIKELAPALHVDISSNVGFVTQLASLVPVDFYELNPPLLSLPNLAIIKASLARLPLKDSSINSLSCLHVLEHIGLGRYGDPIDPNGMKKACDELSRVLQEGGHLFISFPIGRERIEFNSQRVTDPTHISWLFPNLTLVEFSIVSDEKKFIENADIVNSKNQEYACGLYHLVKKKFK